MLRLKKTFAALMLVVALSVAVPAQQAQAGILFLAGAIATPASGVVGVTLLVVGFVYDSWLLVILDENGNATKTTLEAALAQKYSFIEDSEAVADLADMIREKAAAGTPDSEGRIMVSLTADEVISALEPTGLVESAPEKVEQLVQDLQ